ncbi:hypothetical protein Sya03_49660 [Spirilliplanes yamanashiensis]|uniref:OmpR/PhoB-type domain-containing protein n=2 Tax=Spirilliplanes yamanashiensis TaxID=42233 RepID=A0A8J3YCK2_9ACTN|nr:DNA-binding SARP family transcriptional activator [Spirilliplanes yamanashiensis]GIJ05614.1 hypothetical protein Sya03_49660 [Spirilliplanes yamanashiensis]
MDAGAVVPAAGLIDRVWGNDPPDGALNVLYSYVCRLRRALGPAGVPLLRRSGGYLLDVDRDRVDVHRFRRLAATADAAPDPAAALDAALALWGGTALSGLAGPWAGSVRATLDDERVAVLMARNEVHLAAGRPAEVVRVLRDAVAARPDDERLVEQLMLALYRCGLPAEARRQYRAVADRAAAEGAAPGRRLRDLHERIRRADPVLAVGQP